MPDPVSAVAEGVGKVADLVKLALTDSQLELIDKKREEAEKDVLHFKSLCLGGSESDTFAANAMLEQLPIEINPHISVSEWSKLSQNRVEGINAAKLVGWYARARGAQFERDKLEVVLFASKKAE